MCIRNVENLQNLNQGLKKRFPHALLIAEDSTAYPGVTAPVSQNGLGFDYKWDLGWMNDTLSYFQAAPSQRTQLYHKLTFSMHYFYNEHYLLPLSHDEVVHGKASIVQKMNGGYEDKFPQARALYLYMYAHPGIKLSFMGNELGQLREWDEKREQDWELEDYPLHKAFHRFLRELNHCYLTCPALWELDSSREGFQWIDCHQEEACIYVFERISDSQTILAIFNFSDMTRSYIFTCDRIRTFRLLIASDMTQFGGTCDYPEKELLFRKKTAEFTLSAFSGRWYLLD